MVITTIVDIAAKITNIFLERVLMAGGIFDLKNAEGVI